ncbi:MAG: LysM peptidoglycan-binding domain-containing protein [Bacteroidetes bacterium]|uniref:LysM peptidoglycan-binding domain-containing protein n=1 Tax=Candidatus Cryptobacteroides gallistercoris TaxID=2840765 RepID=A0A940DS57_9BACT|nr:LysM peptidoglycan-binding domain-containing protein [Candidatus Cryptobacteroides gallistercoris]
MNRRILFIFLAISCLLAFSTTAEGQYPQVPVSISTEKVKIGGKVFYSHIVLEKQTLYSISKAYGVTVQEIYDANPSLQTEGLKKNAIILIPVKTAASGTAASGTAAAEKAESAEAAADRSEKMSEDTEGRRPGAEMKSPRRKDREKGQDVYIVHTVRWYEDLNVISIKYGVPVEIIMEVNGLTGRKLKNRQKLRIPADLKAYLMERNASAGNETDKGQGSDSGSDAGQTEDSGTDEPAAVPPARTKTEVRATLMLPLDAKDGTGSESNMDFYSGALLAARDLGMEGTDVDLNVYDAAAGTPNLSLLKIMMTDVTIGPVSKSSLSALLETVPDNKYVVSPFDQRAESLVASNRNFIQAPASVATQYENLTDWIKESRAPGEHLIVVFEKGMRESAESNAAETYLQASGQQYSSFSYSILEGRNILLPLKGLMDSGTVNRVLVISESEAFVNDLVRNLNLLIHENYRIVLYGPSKLRSFETIDVEDYHNVNLHVAMSYYVDYDSPEVQAFLLKYRALFNTEPGPFAFQGYDLMRYFAKACTRYGSGWGEAIEEMETARMLQSDFKFRRYGDGGLENIGIRRLVYGPDYSVRLL